MPPGLEEQARELILTIMEERGRAPRTARLTQGHGNGGHGPHSKTLTPNMTPAETAALAALDAIVGQLNPGGHGNPGGLGGTGNGK